MILKFQNTIALKIGLLLLLIILVLLANYGVLTNKVKVVNDSVNRILSISNNSIFILEINKDVVELQRDVSVFGQSGRDTIFTKMTETQNSLTQRLQHVRKETDDANLLATIDNMETLVSRYGENLIVLQELYRVKSKLIDVQLPHLFKQGQATLSKMYLQSRGNDRLAITRAQNTWLKMERAATLFLNKKQFLNICLY